MSPRPTLILVPGLVNDAAAWRHQAAALRTRADVRVAEHGERDSLADFARDVLAAAPSAFAIAGHSMGGRIALEVHRLAPDRVRGLALLDTHFRALPAGEAARPEVEKRRAFVELASREGMRAMLHVWIRDMVHPLRLAQDHALVEEIVAMMSRSSAAAFERQVRALLDRPDAGDVLSLVRCPTLVLCGHEDSTPPPAAQEETARLVPGAEFVVVPDCGHMSMLERPEAVTAALQRWLDRVDRADPPVN